MPKITPDADSEFLDVVVQGEDDRALNLKLEGTITRRLIPRVERLLKRASEGERRFITIHISGPRLEQRIVGFVTAETFDELVLLVGPAQAPSSAFASYQARTNAWMMSCFGEAITVDARERNLRFLEEALELVQSRGLTASEAHQLVDYVFGRPVGQPAQELGGVMVTLTALASAAKLDIGACAETELDRVWRNMEKVRAKQELKPKFLPIISEG